MLEHVLMMHPFCQPHQVTVSLLQLVHSRSLLLISLSIISSGQSANKRHSFRFPLEEFCSYFLGSIGLGPQPDHCSLCFVSVSILAGPFLPCLVLVVSLRQPLVPGCLSVAVCCLSVAESWVPVLLAPPLESLGPNDSWLSVNPGGTGGFFLLGALPRGAWRMPGEAPSGKSPVSLGVQLLLLSRE